jgi:hypothetical protein
MRKSVLTRLLVLMGAAVAWSAAAQDCQYHNAKATWSGAAVVDPGDFDRCVEFNLVGTLNGRYKVCWYWDDLKTGHEIYGDGWGQMETSYCYSWIETDEGSLACTVARARSIIGSGPSRVRGPDRRQRTRHG